MDRGRSVTCIRLESLGCQEIFGISGQWVIPSLAACEACVRTSPSYSVNDVTVSLSLGVLKGDKRKQVKQQYGHLLKREATKADAPRLSAVLTGVGVGSCLWKLLESIGVSHTASCGCLEWAERLNAWGPAGCRLAREEIVNHLRESGQVYRFDDRMKVAIRAVLVNAKDLIRERCCWMNPLDPYGSLLDKSIITAENWLVRNAENQEGEC